MNALFPRIARLFGAVIVAWWPVAAAAAEVPSSSRFVRPCPDTPNCVSSRDRYESRYIRPLPFEDRADQAWRNLRTALLEEPRTVVVSEGPWTLRAESASLVFRFVDDLEFQLIPDEHIIDVRSASRVGYWDLGVNRRRIERIRERFNALRSKR